MKGQSDTPRGSLLFALLFMALALFLLSQLGVEAKYSSKGKLFAQPAFWPGIAVIGMAVFGGLHLIASAVAMRKHRRHDAQTEAGAKVVEAAVEGRTEVLAEVTAEVGTEVNTTGSTRSDSLIWGELKEGRRWLRALEYFGWFMVYVYITPVIGYLASTVLFLVLLTWRVGYRNRRMVITSVAVGFAIVLLFKSFLGVKIPGGAIYELLPDSIRSFMIVNF